MKFDPSKYKYHAPLGPSSSKRWLSCPGSFALSQTAPKAPSSSFAREGTLAHGVAEWALENDVPLPEVIGTAIQVDDHGEKVSVTIDKELEDGIRPYVDHVRRLRDNGGELHVERRFKVPLEVVVDGQKSIRNDILWGTSDATVVRDFGAIDVVDLKYGVGVPVEPKDNPQCAAYALGAILTFEDHCPTELRIHICQPRLDPRPKIWEVPDIDDFVHEWTERFTVGAQRCIDETETFVTGGHCQFCPAITVCEEFKKNVAERAVEEFETTDGTLCDSDLDELLYYYERLSVLGSFRERVKDRLLEHASEGGRVPGYTVEPSYGRRKWARDDESLSRLLYNRGLRQSDFMDKKIVSPSKLQKVLDDPKFFEKYTTVEQTGQKLVKEG
jgi:hypothetical protein